MNAGTWAGAGASALDWDAGPSLPAAGAWSPDRMAGLLRRLKDALAGRAAKARAAEDARVIRRCRDGDIQAFAELVRRYMDAAMRLSAGFLGNQEDAMDASQDAFVRALEALPRFDPERPFFPWFYVIVKNVCLNRLRRRRRLGEVPLDEAAHPADAGAAEVGAAEVRAALEALSPEHREVLVLRHWQELSYEEIAAATGAPLGTVMSRLHYGRKELRQRLGPGRGGPI